MIKKTPFDCPCLQTVWRLLIRVCNQVYKTRLEQPFWENLSKVIDYFKHIHVEKKIFNAFRSGINLKDDFEIFFLWFIGHLLTIQNEAIKVIVNVFHFKTKYNFKI